MHFWSLGVEEQYYIIIPIFLSLLWSKTRTLFILLAALAFGSFAFNIILVGDHPSAAFYLPMSRFWEMLLGGFLAWFNSPVGKLSKIKNLLGLDDTARRVAKNIFSLLGFALIVCGLVVIDESMRFPGWWALIPCIGAVLLIGAGEHAYFNRVILSVRIPIYVGLISYPLYLWHWPALVFAKLLTGGQPSRLVIIVAVSIAFGMACLTYHFIELPLRSAKFKNLVPSLQRPLFCLLLALGGTAFVFSRFEFAALRFDGANQTLASNHEFIDDSICKKKTGVPSDFCRITSPVKPMNVALLGDSHAYHLYAGFEAYFANRPDGLIAVGSGNCVPFYEVNTLLHKRSKNCAEVFGPLIRQIIADPKIGTVILSSYAIASIDGDVNGDHIKYISLTDIGGAPNSTSQDVYLRGLRRTVEMLQKAGKRVVFFLDNPELDFDPVGCLKRPLRLSVLNDYDVPRNIVEKRFGNSRPLIVEALKSFAGVLILDPMQALCNASACLARIDGQILYQDRNHLSENGSRFVVEYFSDELNGFIK